MEYVTLNNGIKMPKLGYGVFQVEQQECEQCVMDALASGYRLIDTAQAYGNEQEVGQAILNSGVPREDVFLTTKVWVSNAGYEQAKASIYESLRKLQCDYLDMVLIHQPMGDYYGTYRAMEELYEEGIIKAIGVCNFYPHVLADFCESVRIMPAVNQIELHPFFQQEDALKLMKDYGVQAQAWGPLAEGKHGIFTNPMLTKIGERYGKSAAQVVLRWNLQRDVVIIPKSVHKERMQQNIEIFDFALSSEEMKCISRMDLGHSEIVDHYDPVFVKRIHGMKL